MLTTSHAPALPEQAFRYRHSVTFEETNLVGNVYFTRHLAWQGRCREMFIRDNAPSVLADLSRDLRLVTLHVSCDYHCEIFAFDDVEIEMRLASMRANRVRLEFSYWRGAGTTREMVARGAQEIAAMRLTETGLAPCEMPPALAHALRRYLPVSGGADVRR